MLKSEQFRNYDFNPWTDIVIIFYGDLLSVSSVPQCISTLSNTSELLMSLSPFWASNLNVNKDDLS